MTTEDGSALTELGAEIVALRTQLRALTVRVERADSTANRAVSGLDDLEAGLAQAASVIQAGESAAAQALDSGGNDGVSESAPEPLDMDVLHAWVDDHIALWAQRKTPQTGGPGVRWCGSWFEHPEAITRLEALRRAWKEFVVQPGAAMVVYYRDYFDPMMDRLTGEYGPFHACSVATHSARGTFLTNDPRVWRSHPQNSEDTTPAVAS